MKKIFETPVLEVVILETEDVITTSFNGKDDELGGNGEATVY